MLDLSLPKEFGQLCQPVHDPFLAMLIGSADDGIHSAQKSPSYAA